MCKEIYVETLMQMNQIAGGSSHRDAKIGPARGNSRHAEPVMGSSLVTDPNEVADPLDDLVGLQEARTDQQEIHRRISMMEQNPDLMAQSRANAAEFGIDQ